MRTTIFILALSDFLIRSFVVLHKFLFVYAITKDRSEKKHCGFLLITNIFVEKFREKCYNKKINTDKRIGC